jgi:hypothetical protein
LRRIEMDNIKSKAHAEQLAADIVNAAKLIFRSDRADDFAYTIEDNGGEEGDGFSIMFPWCGVDTGWPITTKSIVGDKEVLGYRIFVMEHSHATRWEPEDAWDVTAAESLYRAEIIEAVLIQYLKLHLGWVFPEQVPVVDEIY